MMQPCENCKRLEEEIERLKNEISKHKGSSCEEAQTFEDCMSSLSYGDWE